MKNRALSLPLSTFFLISTFSLSLHAAVPLRWTVETSRLKPAVFEVVRGETLDLEATFNSYGTPVATSNMTAFLCWQTNGMANAWWTTNAVTSGNSARVLFTPEMDPGAPVVNAFIGLSDATNVTSSLFPVPSSLSYRAAITLRFRHGPGAVPNVIEMPPRVLDLAHTVVINEPWPTKADFASTTTVMRAELKDYVDQEISGAGLVTPQSVTNTVTNIVTKSFVEGLGINAGLRTNDVSIISANQITNHVTSGYLCTVATAQAKANEAKEAAEANVNMTYDGNYIWLGGSTPADATTVGFSWDSTTSTLGYEGKNINIDGASEYASFAGSLQNGSLVINGETWIGENSATLDFYTKSEIDSTSVTNLGAVAAATNAADKMIRNIDVGVTSVNSKTGSVTITASDVGAYPNTSGQQLSAQVATQGAHLNAEDAQFVSTNYDSQVNLPEALVKIKLQHGGTNVWRTIWEEIRRWNAFCGTGFNWQTWGGFHTWSTNLLAIVEETSPKEYAFYDGVTGEVAPDGFFWISQPRIGICAGAGYQRYLDARGAVWILESNGLVANIGGTTNGYFRISDEDGNTQFEIIKGDKQTIPAITRSMRREEVMGVTHWICDYAVTNAVSPPVAKFCRDLGANPPVWIANTDTNNCPCNVTWTPGVNTYTLEFWPKSTEPTMFCKAEYDRGGKTMIRQAVPVEMQTIMIGGTEYSISVTEINGKKVPQLTEVN